MIRPAALAAALVLAAPAAAAPVTEEAAKPGYAAPGFKVIDLKGDPAGLSAHRGKVVLLNFWASWCAPCVDEMPALAAAQAALPATSFTVVALAQDIDAADVRAFLADHPVNFPVALDEDNAVARLYKVRALPVTFVIDKRGRVVERIVGPREWAGEAWRAKLAALAAAP